MLCVVLEAVWATVLGKSEGFSKLSPAVVFAFAFVASMAELAYAMRDLPVGTAYAMWVGIGAVLTSPVVAHGVARQRTGGMLSAAGLSVITMLIPQSPATGTAEAEPACPYAQIVFARGTFEQPGVGETGHAFVDALSDRLGGKSVDVYAANYPASLDFKYAAEGLIDVRNKVESIAAPPAPRSSSAVTLKVQR